MPRKYNPYRDRHKENSHPIYKLLESIYTDKEELDKTAAEVEKTRRNAYDIMREESRKEQPDQKQDIEL